MHMWALCVGLDSRYDIEVRGESQSLGIWELGINIDIEEIEMEMEVGIDIRYSTFGIRHSAFDIRHSTFLSKPNMALFSFKIPKKATVTIKFCRDS